MVKKKAANTDGVTQRRTRRDLGDFKNTEALQVDKKSQMTLNKAIGFEELPKKKRKGMHETIESTRSKTDESGVKVSSRKARRKSKRLARKQSRRKKAAKHPIWTIVKRFVLAAVVAIVALGGFIGIKSWIALNNIIDRDGDGALALQENIDPSMLNGEGDGRVNIMILGIGGPKHEAGDLADTIMIVSIDPFALEGGMLSIPRDLYVDVPGYWGTRINAAHSIGNEQQHPGGGIALMQETLESVLDIPIHYYVRVDFQGFIQAIDAVGGIDIKLENAIYDPNFDWQYGANALNLPAGNVHLDGITALLLARSRNATGRGYGVNNDFDRTDNQRKMVIALKEKALSLGTLTNPSTILSLLDAADKHVRTNLQVSEILRVIEIISSIGEEKIVSYGLDNTADNYLVGADINGASVQVPKTGNFDEIQKFVRGIFTDGFIKQEAATIDVLNGTKAAGVATEVGNDLASYGYIINLIADASKKNYQNTVIYDLSKGKKPFTKRLLEQRFGITMSEAKDMPGGITSEVDFVIVVGKNGT